MSIHLNPIFNIATWNKASAFFSYVTLTVVVVAVEASSGEPVESCKRNKKTKHCVYWITQLSTLLILPIGVNWRHACCRVRKRCENPKCNIAHCKFRVIRRPTIMVTVLRNSPPMLYNMQGANWRHTVCRMCDIMFAEARNSPPFL